MASVIVDTSKYIHTGIPANGAYSFSYPNGTTATFKGSLKEATDQARRFGRMLGVWSTELVEVG